MGPDSEVKHFNESWNFNFDSVTCKNNFQYKTRNFFGPFRKQNGILVLERFPLHSILNKILVTNLNLATILILVFFF